MDHHRNRKRRSIYLTDKDFSSINVEASNQSMSFSSYVVECAAAKQAPTQQDKQQLIDFYLELGRLGNNINQIARSFNQHQPKYTALAAELVETLDLLKTIRKELVK